MFSLAVKYAVVTGGSRDTGKGIARAMAKTGAIWPSPDATLPAAPVRRMPVPLISMEDSAAERP